MNYKELTVYNYKLSYYVIRIFTFLWLGLQYQQYLIFLNRPKEFYYSTIGIQKLLFPSFPEKFYFISLIIITALFLLISIFKPKVIYNIIVFLLIATINLPLAAYHKIGHHNHLFVLSFFFGIFLLPQKLKKEDYIYVQYFYAGLLMSYTLAGIWKWISIFKDIIMQSPSISWIELNAAKLNTLVNFHVIDKTPPEWMMSLYSYEKLWVIITIFGILTQALSIIGAFSRKYLTFAMLFLISFHIYNIYFVKADFTIAIITVIILFFPYHLFYREKV